MTITQETSDPWLALLAQVDLAWPATRWRDLGVVVGCSGGADSVGLLTILCRLREIQSESARNSPRGFLVAAHFNHGLRGDESDADEAFVRALAARLGIGFAANRSTEGHRDEASMRGQRMQFLVETAHQYGARYVALAHSADDNVETVLHHLLRGTGPAGLAGIGTPRSIGGDLVLVRPLLGIGRDLVRSGLQSRGQSWREDSSNADVEYRRNWIRHRLIPLIESEYPQAVDAISRAVEAQREWRWLIDRLADQWIESHCRSNDPLTLCGDRETERPIIVAAVQAIWEKKGWSRGAMNREHWLRLAATIESPRQERYTLPGHIDVVATSDSIEIVRLGASDGPSGLK